MILKRVGRFAFFATMAFFCCVYVPMVTEAAGSIENIYYEEIEGDGNPVRIIIEGKKLDEVSFSEWLKGATLDAVTETSGASKEKSFLDSILDKEKVALEEQQASREGKQISPLNLKISLGEVKPHKKLKVPESVQLIVIDKKNLTLEIPGRDEGKWGMTEASEFIPKDKAEGRKFDQMIYVFTTNPRPEFIPEHKDDLKGKVIILDPGHGGKDVGAVGQNGIYEKDVNLAVALQLTAELEKWGSIVHLTRATDTYKMDELGDRVRFGVKHEGDIFISLHSDAALNKEAKGFTVYYFKEKGKDDLLLANCIRNSMKKMVPTQDRGVRSANFYVTKRNPLPAILIEMGFISNIEEEQELINPEFQLTIVESSVQGIANYFSDQRKNRK